MEVGADGQGVHEQAEEPVQREEGGVHPVGVWGGGYQPCGGARLPRWLDRSGSFSQTSSLNTACKDNVKLGGNLLFSSGIHKWNLSC